MSTTLKSEGKKQATPRMSTARKAAATFAAAPASVVTAAPAKRQPRASRHILVRTAAGGKRSAPFNFGQVYELPPHKRIEAIKRGVPAKHVDILAGRMGITKEALIATLRLSRATVNRKARTQEPLSQDESERVLGIEYLIGQVDNMVRESGNPAGFDAAKWVSAWLQSALPALDNRTPSSYMDTIEGQKMVSNLLAMAQTGAYA